MKKIRPISPGELLKEEFLEPMAISQYRLAKEIEVPAKRITIKRQLLKEPARIERVTVPAKTKIIKEKQMVKVESSKDSEESAVQYVVAHKSVEKAEMIKSVSVLPWYVAPVSEPFVYKLGASAALLSGVVSHSGEPGATVAYYKPEISDTYHEFVAAGS